MTPDQRSHPRTARIIPVLDVMGGQVVRAVGGRREMYAPGRSKLTDSTEPLRVAEVLLAAAGVNEIYAADIDALQGHRPRPGWVRDLIDRGCRVMVDVGVRTAADAKTSLDTGAAVVVATETVAGVDVLKDLVGAGGPERVVLSLDLRNERVMGNESVWGPDPDPVSVIEVAVGAGVNRVLVLELARIGTEIGPGTTDLCGRLRQRFPAIELLAGGGVRNWDDVDQLAAVGVDGVLVASALHDGTMKGPRPT
ncbi:MAG: hisA/hisF family protein [Gemmataceae bacterium]|nr:hisA/hisF family protein [Gemmataceae bacterium]